MIESGQIGWNDKGVHEAMVARLPSSVSVMDSRVAGWVLVATSMCKPSAMAVGRVVGESGVAVEDRSGADC